MTKNFDEYKEDEELPIKFITRCQIIDHELPGLLVMLVEYFDSIQDEDAGKTSALNLAISIDAAEMLDGALIDAARTHRKKPETKN
jgi:hypothetical protein